MWEKRASTGEPGSEGGRVLEDETYKGECRITRERCQADDAITCEVYGDMVHTVFCEPEALKAVYEKMKQALAAFIDSEITDSQKRANF